MPANAVVRAALRTGEELDRERAREFRRELRRAEALDVAGRALARRDVARAELEQRLERRGVTPVVRDEALDRLTELGAVDDDRFARARAAHLAERGYGDAAIRADLEQRGVAGETAEEAVATLESEVARMARILEARGASTKTLTFLARRGFGEDAVADAADALL